MRCSASRTVVLGLVLLMFAGKAWAWGNEGHKIVCRIAYMLLDADEQAEVNRLTELYRQPDGQKYRYFTDACIFADKARSHVQSNAPRWSYFSRFNRWHFLNVPRDTRDVTEEHCGDDCVLEGIEYHSARLANDSLEDWKRAEALFFLGHWVGDIHQPLHVSFADDLGGNSIKPILGGYYGTSGGHLHYVWDSGIIRKAMGNGDWLAYAATLKSRITPALRAQWDAAAPLEWAQESYALTITDDVDYCEWEQNDEGAVCSPEGHTRNLGVSYQQKFQDDVELRLQQAGSRLADQIQAALGM